MSSMPEVRLGAQYPNPDARSSGKAVNSRANSRRATSLKLAAQLAAQIGMVRSWPNLQTIRLAIECEAEYSCVSHEDAADLIRRAAQQESYAGGGYRCLSSWESAEIARLNSVDRFWFEDMRWRMKPVYQAFECELAKQRTGICEIDDLLIFCRDRGTTISELARSAS